MADVVAEFILGDEEPTEAVFTVEPDVEYKADISLETGTKDHSKLYNRELPDQHPISAITGLEEALNRLDTFIYEQAVASDTWEIEHNLGRFPSVEVVDTAGNKFFPAVQWINENKLIITMNGATKGKAFLN